MLPWAISLLSWRVTTEFLLIVPIYHVMQPTDNACPSSPIVFRRLATSVFSLISFGSCIRIEWGYAGSLLLSLDMLGTKKKPFHLAQIPVAQWLSHPFCSRAHSRWFNQVPESVRGFRPSQFMQGILYLENRLISGLKDYCKRKETPENDYLDSYRLV